MRKICYVVAFIFLFLPVDVYSQCYACDAYADALKNPVEVRMLQLRSTKEQPDERIAACQQLQVLFWEDAGIVSLPSAFGKLQNLTDLSLANNKLTDLPEEIFQLKNLKVLNLQGNAFDEATRSRLKKELAQRLPNTKVFL